MMRKFWTLVFFCACWTLSVQNERKLSIRLVTWNAGDEGPDNVDLDALLTPSTAAEVVVLGLEELGDRDAWFELIENTFNRHDYIKLADERIGDILELVYVKASILPRISNVLTSYKGTGFLGIFNNKGGVSIRFDYGGRSFVFVNSHLAAGHDKAEDRIEDYEQILEKHYFRHPTTPGILDHDYVFWQGDLNSRLDGLTKPEAERLIPEQLDQLFKHDQLKRQMEKGIAFNGFVEMDVRFAPTYKFDKGTDRYDTSAKQRIPAWTDRILYRIKPGRASRGLAVQGTSYDSFAQYTLSDHKPVVMTCSVLL